MKPDYRLTLRLCKDHYNERCVMLGPRRWIKNPHQCFYGSAVSYFTVVDQLRKFDLCGIDPANFSSFSFVPNDDPFSYLRPACKSSIKLIITRSPDL